MSQIEILDSTLAEKNQTETTPNLKQVGARLLSKLVWKGRSLTYPYLNRLYGAGPGAQIGGGIDVVGPQRIRLGRNFQMQGPGRLHATTCTMSDPHPYSLEFGANANIYPYCSFVTAGGYITVGDDFIIQSFVLLDGIGGIEIGNQVMLGTHVQVYSSNHQIKRNQPIRNQALDLRRTVIGNDVWVGGNAVILGGVTIGNGAVVGAGAIVTKDVPEYAIVVGSPARVVRYRE